MNTNHVDVLIIGAGLSGVGAACHLRRECPSKTFAIVERRKSMGGTWDLFKYPGIRSDSDMFTLGYNFKPWKGTKVLASGPEIKKYIQEAAKENRVEDHIHFGLKGEKLEWDTDSAIWTLTSVNEETGEKQIFSANFVIGCTGYYNYDKGYAPNFPGIKQFKGQVVHPQFWPEDLNYAGKKVVVIGSGATAITLIPSMAEKTEHITMLQRSPTYVASVPSVDPFSEKLRKYLPMNMVYRLGRARNVGLQRMIYQMC
ncbi:MAG: NAD(P)/FAD-dependent oxidoreductase, partial [Limnobacter sp.]|nr:NAD(P)/FAD-dependent oxidoreductase [Limnobacter sp.]